MMDSIGLALSGMRAYRKGLVANADNVANLNTEGYERARTTFSATPGGGVEARVTREPNPSEDATSVDLAEEAVDNITFANGYRANAAMVRQSDRMVGALLDMFG